MLSSKQYAGDTCFIIHQDDAGSAAYRDEYVLWLEREIERLQLSVETPAPDSNERLEKPIREQSAMELMETHCRALDIEIERLRERVKDLQQFHDWAEPQITDLNRGFPGETNDGLLTEGIVSTYVCGDHAGLRLELYYDKPEQAHSARDYVENLIRAGRKNERQRPKRHDICALCGGVWISGDKGHIEHTCVLSEEATR